MAVPPATELDLSEAGLVTTEQAAVILGTSIAYVRRLRHMGHLRPFNLAGFSQRRGGGRPVFYRKSDIEQYRDTHPKLGTNPRLGLRAEE